MIHGDSDRSLPNIVNLSIPGVDAESAIDAWADLCRHLRWRGLHVSVVHLQPCAVGDATFRRADGRRLALLLVPHVLIAGFRRHDRGDAIVKPETIAYKRSRFSTRLPVQYRYTASHYWLRESEPGIWQVGFTKFATRMLGEMVEFEFKVQPGARIEVWAGDRLDGRFQGDERYL